MEATRRRPGLAVAVGASLIVFLVQAAATTAGPGQSPGALRALLAEAIADEKRALELLAKVPPRAGTAQLRVERSVETLEEILEAESLPDTARDAIRSARADDLAAIRSIRAQDSAFWITEALQSKEAAMALLRQPRVARGPQCADGKDNDGDGLVDARHDSGCTDRADGSERSRLALRLELTTTGPAATIEGATSGPISKIEIALPPPSAFDTARQPAVGSSPLCRFRSARRLECLTRDGAANPRHVVTARFWLTNGSPSELRVLVRDFAGRGSATTLRPMSVEQPFSLGPSPVPATGTFTNGRGGCPFPTSFTDMFWFLAPGDGTLTITQPTTGDRVSGPIGPDGSFRLRSPGESYDGKIAGNRATATYSYTRNGCTETYDAAFALQR